MKFDGGEIAAIHPSIVKALCRVQASLEAVAKSELNKHGAYKYSSVDDIYAAVTRKLAEAGLVIMPIEMEPVGEISATVAVFDKDGTKTGEKQITKLRFHYGYILATEEATWFDPRSARTLVMLHTGPQTFNAAESFCQKAYLRALMKMPTGEKDLDEFAQADTLEDQVANVGKKSAPRKASAEGKRDGSVKVFNAIQAALKRALTADDAWKVWRDHSEALSTMPRQWFETLADDFVTHMWSFGVEVELDDGWPVLPPVQEAA